MSSIYDFLNTEASSSTTGGVNAAEGQDPSTVNDGVRQLKQILAAFADDHGAVNTVGGTGDAITVTLGLVGGSNSITAYATGQHFRFIASAANTGAATMNVNSIGAKAIRKISGGTDVALSAGDIAAGETYLVRYSATANSAAGAWILVGGAAIAAATTSAAGIVELATNAETIAGTDTSRAVTPSTLYFSTGHLYGLTLSNNGSDATNDIDIAAGTARDGSDTVNMILAAALTKRLDASWAVGSGNGGLDTGSIANTTYHVWLIKRSDTGVVDALFSTSASAPTMPTNYDYKRRIGSIVRTGGAIKAFSQNGDEFRWVDVAGDVNVTSPGTSAATRTLTVPTGIVVTAMIRALLNNTSAGTAANVLFTALTDTDVAPNATPGNNHGVVQNASGFSGFATNDLRIRTNTSGQIRSRNGLLGDGNITLQIVTYGWIDTRGRT